jgi:hypothetical protein
MARPQCDTPLVSFVGVKGKKSKGVILTSVGWLPSLVSSGYLEPNWNQNWVLKRDLVLDLKPESKPEILGWGKMVWNLRLIDN